MMATSYKSNGAPAQFIGLTEHEKEKVVIEYLPRLKIWVLRAKAGLPDSVDIDELYSAASLGLIECLERFDKSRNITFGTYVEHRVKGAILDALRGLDFLSRNARSKVKMLDTASEELRNTLGRSPTTKEVAVHLELDDAEVYKIQDLQVVDSVLRLDDAVGDDEGATLLDFVRSTDLNPEEITLKNNAIQRLAEEIDNLNQRERTVVSLYYYEELTMKEVAEVLDLTESRVSQIHSAAVIKMRKRLGDIA